MIVEVGKKFQILKIITKKKSPLLLVVLAISSYDGNESSTDIKKNHQNKM